jgi:ParB-like nuclease domain
MSPTPKRALRIDDPIAALSPDPADTISEGEGRLREIAIDQIQANRDRPRKHFDETSLRSPAESISERGVLQPVIVRPGPPADTNSSPVNDAGARLGSPGSPPFLHSSRISWIDLSRSSWR